MLCGHVKLQYIGDYPPFAQINRQKAQTHAKGVLASQFTQVDSLLGQLVQNQTAHRFQQIEIPSKMKCRMGCLGKMFTKISYIPSKWTVKQEECVGCGACVNACPYDNFVVENGKAHLKEQIDCCGCYACFHHCPKRAIVDPKGKLEKKA